MKLGNSDDAFALLAMSEPETISAPKHHLQIGEEVGNPARDRCQQAFPGPKVGFAVSCLKSLGVGAEGRDC